MKSILTFLIVLGLVPFQLAFKKAQPPVKDLLGFEGTYTLMTDMENRGACPHRLEIKLGWEKLSVMQTWAHPDDFAAKKFQLGEYEYGYRGETEVETVLEGTSLIETQERGWDEMETGITRLADGIHYWRTADEKFNFTELSCRYDFNEDKVSRSKWDLYFECRRRDGNGSEPRTIVFEYHRFERERKRMKLIYDQADRPTEVSEIKFYQRPPSVGWKYRTYGWLIQFGRYEISGAQDMFGMLRDRNKVKSPYNVYHCGLDRSKRFDLDTMAPLD